MLNIVNKEDVEALFDQLLPWEKRELALKLYTEQANGFNCKELLSEFGFSPFDIVNERDCVDYFCTSSLLDEMDEDTVGEWLESSDISPYYCTERLKTAWDSDIDRWRFSDDTKEDIIELAEQIKASDKEEEK